MTDRKRRSTKRWSHNAGQRGINWVRAFEHSRDDSLYLEWLEAIPGVDRGPRDHSAKPRRRRKKLAAEDQSRGRAIQRAEALAERFAELADRPVGVPTTLGDLIDHYLKEKTPTKGKGKQEHDFRARRLFATYFSGLVDSERRLGRCPSSLDRVDWDGFIRARGSGQIPGWRPVAERQVQYDLKFLIAVLNWGSGANPMGSALPYLPSGSPWRSEVRRAQRWRMPFNKTPHRPSMTPELRDALTRHSPSWQFEAALILERDTRRRNNSIRQLDWRDIDQRGWTICWKGEFDKDKREAVTPLLSEEAKEVLRRAPSRGLAGPVFPSSKDPGQPTPSFTFQVWLRRAKAAFLKSLPESERANWKEKLRGVGYHAEKRAGVRDPEFRSLPAKIQETIAGTQYTTLRDVYDEVTTEDVTKAWEARQRANRAFR